LKSTSRFQIYNVGIHMLIFVQNLSRSQLISNFFVETSKPLLHILFLFCMNVYFVSILIFTFIKYICRLDSQCFMWYFISRVSIKRSTFSSNHVLFWSIYINKIKRLKFERAATRLANKNINNIGKRITRFFLSFLKLLER
jgi:hypothetical protein